MSVSSQPGATGLGTGDPGTDRYDPDREPLRPEASLGDLLSEMTSELSNLFRKEIELAKTEARQEASQAGKAGALFGGAAVAAWMALLLLSLALAWLLDRELNRPLSFAIVGVVWLIAAFIFQRVARTMLERLRGLPQTTQTIKEDITWAKAQKS